MANSTSGRLWTGDTLGILSNSAVWLQRIVYRPAAASQIMQLNSYGGVGQVVAANQKASKTGTISGTNTLTSNTNFPATIAVGDVIEILGSTGTAANVHAKAQISTLDGGTNYVTCVGAGWTNESTKVYSWAIYPQQKEVYLVGGASDASGVTLDWGPAGRWFPNLVLAVIGGGAVDLYIK